MRGCATTIVAGWLLLLGVGVGKWWSLQVEPEGPAWRAARDLRTNHQLRAGDLKKEKGWFQFSALPPLGRLLGRHLTHAVKKGERVDVTELRLRPFGFYIPRNYVGFVYPLSADQKVTADFLSIGDQVYLGARAAAPIRRRQGRSVRTGLARISGPLLVCAVHRGTGEAPADWLVLAVPCSKSDKVPALLARANLLQMRGRGTTPPPPPIAAHVKIIGLLPNPPVDEKQNEEVEMKNAGSVAVSLRGWKLRTKSGGTWSLATLETLAPRQTKKIKRNGQPMALNNGGDTVDLLDPMGKVIETVTYPKVDKGEVFTPAN